MNSRLYKKEHLKLNALSYTRHYQHKMIAGLDIVRLFCITHGSWTGTWANQTSKAEVFRAHGTTQLQSTEHHKLRFIIHQVSGRHTEFYFSCYYHLSSSMNNRLTGTQLNHGAVQITTCLAFCENGQTEQIELLGKINKHILSLLAPL